MDAVSTSTPADRASAPTRLALVEGLRRLKRPLEPQAWATRRVALRLSPGGERQIVYTNPNP